LIFNNAQLSAVCIQVLAEYNKSVICFENVIRLQPDYRVASRCRHAVLCHAKLEAVLETQHRCVTILIITQSFTSFVREW